ncbi:MAG: lipopolysaccharide transport periplasmic protein LptA [Desulfobulbus sp.]|nr:lipopolysaccharide transport periplasmic protein LptA [Desulfobulbus sp.]
MEKLHTALRILYCFVIMIFYGGAVSCPAAEDAPAPISIEADRMISQENKNSVVFIGKVDARQGNLIIQSDEMTVYYTEKKDEQTTGTDSRFTNQVDRLICTNNVKISEGDWLGTGDRMDYFAKERKAVLSGNAKAWQGQNMVSGKTIVYYLDEKRSVIEPGAETKGRVRAVIHPEPKKK